MCQNMTITIDGMKVDKGKGLMSNPNRALGEWLLDDVLKIAEGQLVTIEMLRDLGIDSVEVRKNSESDYEIDFKKNYSFDQFKIDHS